MPKKPPNETDSNGNVDIDNLTSQLNSFTKSFGQQADKLVREAKRLRETNRRELRSHTNEIEANRTKAIKEQNKAIKEQNDLLDAQKDKQEEQAKAAREKEKAAKKYNEAIASSAPSLKKLIDLETKAKSLSEQISESVANLPDDIDAAFDRLQEFTFTVPESKMKLPGTPPPLPRKSQFQKVGAHSLADLANNELKTLAREQNSALPKFSNQQSHFGAMLQDHYNSTNKLKGDKFVAKKEQEEERAAKKAEARDIAREKRKEARERTVDLAKRSLSTIGGFALDQIGGAFKDIGNYLSLKNILLGAYNYINSKVLPTQAMLNKSLGAGTPLLKSLNHQAMVTGERFQDLGLGFEKGAKDVSDFGVQLRTANISDKNLNTLLKLTEYVGVGSEQVGQFARAFETTGGKIEDIDAVMIQAGKDTQKFNLPLNSVRKDMLENINVMHRFGSANATEFERATLHAQRLGVSIGDISDAFGEKFDTFENVTEAAATLNQAFGTQLDSVQLLNATNMDDRLRMVQQAISQTSFDFSNMGNFRQNILKNSLGIDNSKAAAFFGSQAQQMKAKKDNDILKQKAKLTDDWNNALERTRTTLISFDQQWQHIYLAIDNLLARLFNRKNGLTATHEVVGGIRLAFTRVGEAIQGVADSVPKDFDLTDWLKKAYESARDIFNLIGPTFKKLFLDLDETVDEIKYVTSPRESMLASSLVDDFLAFKRGDKGSSIEKVQADNQALLQAYGPNAAYAARRKSRLAGIDDTEYSSALDNLQSIPRSMREKGGLTPASVGIGGSDIKIDINLVPQGEFAELMGKKTISKTVKISKQAISN